MPLLIVSVVPMINYLETCSIVKRGGERGGNTLDAHTNLTRHKIYDLEIYNFVPVLTRCHAAVSWLWEEGKKTIF